MRPSHPTFAVRQRRSHHPLQVHHLRIALDLIAGLALLADHRHLGLLSTGKSLEECGEVDAIQRVRRTAIQGYSAWNSL